MKNIFNSSFLVDLDQSSEKGNLRSQQKLNTRQQLMESAMTLFVEVGYEQVTLAEIAAHANIHVQTLYKHFKNKPSLATSYFDLYLDLGIDVLETLSPKQNAYEILKKITLEQLKIIMETKKVLAVFQMIHANEELLASTQHRLRLFEDHLTEALKRQKTPKYQELKARLLAAVLVAAYRDSHFSWIRSNGQVSSVEKMQSYFKLIEKQYL
jgi:AcrR family transcriptional regulator